MSIFLMTPFEMMQHMASQVQERRLFLNFSQKTLSQLSGVSYGVLKKFERTGQISLESLLKLSLTLGTLEKFKDLFAIGPLENITSLDQLLEDKKRKRGRK
jgi:transcriptional regulator with XRE-family HTH domain